MKPSLQELLDNLHAELSQTVNLDHEARERLQQLAADIQRTLAGEASSEAAELSSGLLASVDRFEASHPRLTETVGQLAQALAGMGI